MCVCPYTSCVGSFTQAHPRTWLCSARKADVSVALAPFIDVYSTGLTNSLTECNGTEGFGALKGKMHLSHGLQGGAGAANWG